MERPSISFIIKHPRTGILMYILYIAKCLPDKQFIQLQYLIAMGKRLDLKNPKTFNEKIQWLKLYDHNPQYTQMVDKVTMKGYVAGILGEEYIIPTLGVWEKTEDIQWESLPEKFVLKCNHDSGGLIICRDKSKLDIDAAITKLNKSLKNDFYKKEREWPYKNVQRRILAEDYITQPDNKSQDYDLQDYKFFCFNGRVEFFKIDFDRFIEHHANYYDCDWNLLPFGEILCPPNPDKNLEKPRGFDRMIEIAEHLSKNIPFVRVDLYNLSGKIYVGELTLYPAAGLMKLTDNEWDKKIGDMLVLPARKQI